jgi:hypothetical protein
VSAEGRAENLSAKAWTGSSEWVNPSTVSPQAGGHAR